jgi:hypothetical protein
MLMRLKGGRAIGETRQSRGVNREKRGRFKGNKRKKKKDSGWDQ